MCGIAGIFDIRGDARIDAGILQRMSNTLKHRGPDGENCYADGNIGFSFRRLSIIDPETGMQPMFNETRSIVAVCNGEIFNHLELRKLLESRGHQFYSKSDIEVIPHLYEEYGDQLVDHLDGQFAFALYDAAKHRLIAARDHFGVAPFFYTVKDQLLIFASEIKAILSHPLVNKKVDLTGLDQILTFPGLISPRTMFEGISSLPAGHLLIAEEQREPRSREYWDVLFPRVEDTVETTTPQACREEVQALLTESIRKRLLADVEVGLYLSGGLDSSLIACLLHESEPTTRRQSFSIDFVARELSEGRYQRMISKFIQSRHHSRLFEWPEIAERLRSVIRHTETPLQETFDTAALALSESVRANGLKVVLAGQGADEIFGGYVGYRFDNFRQVRPANKTEDPNEARLRDQLWGDADFFYEKDYYRHTQTKQALYSPQIRDHYAQVDCLPTLPINKEHLKGRHPFHQRSYLDLKLRLSDHLLGDHGDRMTFANGVEARYPFLDNRLMERVSQLKPEQILSGYCEKYLLKEIARERVPEAIVTREKLGFAAPATPELLREGLDLVDDLLSPDRIRREGYFDSHAVANLRREYSAPGFRLHVPYESDLLAVIITFGLFLETFEMPNL